MKMKIGKMISQDILTMINDVDHFRPGDFMTARIFCIFVVIWMMILVMILVTVVMILMMTTVTVTTIAQECVFTVATGQLPVTVLPISKPQRW